MMPEWMKKKKQLLDIEEAKIEAKRQRDLAITSLIRLKRDAFWQRLKEQLSLTVEFLPQLNIAGTITPSGNGMRIQISRSGAFANQTHTDVMLTSDAIACNTLDGGSYKLLFCVIGDSEIGVAYESVDGPHLRPDGAAEHIMHQMVDLIESRHR